MIGISEGQVLKFERGKNRVSAGFLYEIACVVNAPISYFFDGMTARPHAATPARHTLAEAVHNFSGIQNEKHQEAFSRLVRTLTGN